MAAEITGRHFESPLLLTLYGLCSGRPNVPVDMAAPFQEVLERAGYNDPMALGPDKNTGGARSATLVRNAKQSLANDDFVIQFGRGQWGLTQKGIKAAEALLAGGSSEPTATAPKAKTPLKVNTVVMGYDAIDGGMLFGPRKGLSNAEEALEVYSYQPCKGWWEHQNAQCVRCKVEGACHLETVNRIIALAEASNASESYGYGVAIGAAKATVPSTASTPSYSPEALELVRNATGEYPSRSGIDRECLICGKKIPAQSGETVVSHAPKGGFTIVHTKCWNELRAQHQAGRI